MDGQLVARGNIRKRYKNFGPVHFLPDLFHIQGHAPRRITNGFLMCPLLQKLTDAEQEHNGASRIEIAAQKGKH